MAITAWDDYLIHQTLLTIDAVDSDDTHFQDRFFFTANNADGTLELAAGMGVYPNTNVMDGLAWVRHEGVQRNIRVSRHLQGDRANTVVGPLSFKVLEPQKRWGIYLGDNDHGIGCSVEFEGRTAPYLHTLQPGQSEPERRPQMVHYTQEGRFTGSVTFEGQQFKIDGFFGPRDRSWGVRGGAAPGQPTMEIYQWNHAQFSSFVLVFICIESAGGAVRICTGAIQNDDGSVIPIVDMRHRIDFIPGLRSYTKMEWLLKDVNGKERHLTARPISPVAYMTGGYGAWHGEDRGPLHVEGERWDVSQPLETPSPQFGNYGIPNHRVAEFQLDGEPGIGLLETGYMGDENWQYKPSF